VLKNCENTLEAEHSQIILRMSNLNTTYCKLNRLKEAEKLELSAINIFKKILEAEHSTTSIIINQLCAIFRHQERLKEVNDLLLQVGEIYMSKLETEHSHNLTVSANSVLKYNIQNR
jgi:hypothetical protein